MWPTFKSSFSSEIPLEENKFLFSNCYQFYIDPELGRGGVWVGKQGRNQQLEQHPGEKRLPQAHSGLLQSPQTICSW